MSPGGIGRFEGSTSVPSANWVFKQQKANTQTFGALTLSMASNVTLNDLLVVCTGISETTAGSSTIAQTTGTNASVIWNSVVQCNSGASNGIAEMFYGIVGNTTTSVPTFTVTPHVGYTSARAGIVEFSGNNTSSPVDNFNFNNGSGVTTASGPNITQSVGSELIIMGVDTSAFQTVVNTPSGGFTALTGEPSQGFTMAYLISSDSSNHTTSWPLGGTSNFGVVGASFFHA